MCLWANLLTTILECYCEDDLLHIKYLEEYMENRSQVSGNSGKYMHLFLLIFPLYYDYIFLWIFTFKVTQVFVFAQMFCISYLFIMMTFKIFTSAIEDIRRNKKIWKKEITFFFCLIVGTINWWLSYASKVVKNMFFFIKAWTGITTDAISDYYITKCLPADAFTQYVYIFL